MSLSPEDREALADFECECDLASRCSCDAEMVTAVEAIVALHVAAALSEAAALMSGFLHDPECESCDDVRDCIAIVRAAIPPP